MTQLDRTGGAGCAVGVEIAARKPTTPGRSRAVEPPPWCGGHGVDVAGDNCRPGISRRREATHPDKIDDEIVDPASPEASRRQEHEFTRRQRDHSDRIRSHHRSLLHRIESAMNQYLFRMRIKLSDEISFGTLIQSE
jgi:hypothetical protein